MKNRFLAKEHVYVFLITILSSGFDGCGRPILSFRNRDFRSTFFFRFDCVFFVNPCRWNPYYGSTGGIVVDSIFMGEQNS